MHPTTELVRIAVTYVEALCANAEEFRAAVVDVKIDAHGVRVWLGSMDYNTLGLRDVQWLTHSLTLAGDLRAVARNDLESVSSGFQLRSDEQRQCGLCGRPRSDHTGVRHMFQAGWETQP